MTFGDDVNLGNSSCRRGLNWQLFLSMFLLCLFAFGQTAEANSTIRQVVLSTDKVPGQPAATFGGLGAPSVNGLGCIAFPGGPSPGTNLYSNAHGRQCGEIARAVGVGVVPPGVLGPISDVDFPCLNDDGSIVFRGMDIDGTNRGIYLYLRPGTLRLVADSSTFRPGTSEKFDPTLGPGVPINCSGSYLAFGDGTPTTGGVYLGSVGGTPKKVTLFELASSTSEIVQLAYSIHSLNSSGRAAIEMRNIPEFTNGIYLGQQNTSLLPLVLAGISAPVGATFTDVSEPWLNSVGNIAFMGFLASGRAGIFILRKTGGLSKLVDINADVPQHPGSKFSGILSPYLTDDGTLIFVGIYNFPDPSRPGFFLRFSGIYRKSGSGIQVLFDQFDGLRVNGEKISLIVRDPSGRGTVLRMTVGTSISRFAAIVGNLTKVYFLQELPGQLPGRTTGIFEAARF